MEIVRFDLNNLPEPKDELTLVLGNFDGFHIGHQSLCIKATLIAKKETGILLFDLDSNSILNNKSEFLSSLDDKINYATKLRIDYVYILKANEALFNLSKDDFINKVLKPIGVSKIVVGEDYRFGKNREGTPEYLSRFFDTEIMPIMNNDRGEKISSSTIISNIKNGKIADASTDLGRVYEIKGKVIKGLQNGRALGYRTINIDPSFKYVMPKDGVYYGLGFVYGICYKALINVGKNPTVGELDKSLIEVHLIDFPDNEIYGKTVYVQFHKYVRDEIKFASLDDLKRQIDKDFAGFSLD